MSETDEKIVILGGRGMLGTDLANECETRGIDFEIFDLPDFDITNEEHLRSILKDTCTVINCAAYTNVEKAESEPELAYKINAEAVGRLGILVRKKDIWVLHVSTDFVFDGTNDRPYLETDPPNPINLYGRTKLAGEKLLIESRCRCCIIRFEWTYGLNGNNFVRKLLAKAKQQGKLKVVDDQIGSPTATTEAAKVICDVVGKKPKGVFHYASDGYVSRFGMAGFIVEKLGMSVELESCKTGDFPTVAARPLNSRFNCGKIKKLLSQIIKPWQKPLEDFLRQL